MTNIKTTHNVQSKHIENVKMWDLHMEILLKQIGMILLLANRVYICKMRILILTSQILQTKLIFVQILWIKLNFYTNFANQAKFLYKFCKTR